MVSSGLTANTMSSVALVPTSPFRLTPPSNATAELVTGADAHVPGHQWVYLLLLVVIFVSVVGNVLVCLAIATKKSLHSATNYFLLSMAMADLMVALLVMPMGLIKYIFGMWLLGPAMCNIWVSLDVLCCTSSIMHICTISMDRYLAVCSPFTTHRRSRFQTPTKIVIVWLISTLLCSPIFVLGFVSTTDVLDVKVCALTNRLFMIYGSIVAFFIPLVIVVVTYGRTAHALNKKAKAFAAPESTPMEGTVISRKLFFLKKAVPCYQQCIDTHSNAVNDFSSSDYYAKPPDDETATKDRICLKAITPTPQGSPRVLHAPSQLEKPFLKMRRSSMGKGCSSRINTERKASKVLGIVFVAFLIGWTPFFVTNFLFAVCAACPVNPTLFSIFEWLGWASSMVNPFIYTVFNRTFQQTFWRLLTGKCLLARKGTRQQSSKRPRTVNEIKPSSPKGSSV